MTLRSIHRYQTRICLHSSAQQATLVSVCLNKAFLMPLQGHVTVTLMDEEGGVAESLSRSFTRSLTTIDIHDGEQVRRSVRPRSACLPSAGRVDRG